ncbi:MAG: sodium/proton-translocating pyrophosphatase, partial [bacterium]
MKALLLSNAPFVAMGASLVALFFAFYLINYISKQDPGNDRVQELSGDIQDGAMTFMTREFKYLAVFTVVVAAGLAFMPGDATVPTAVGFVGGAIASSLAGWIVM